MKKLLSTLVSSVLALSMIPAMPVYADSNSDYTCEIKELPYEATVVSSIGGKYFQLRLNVFDKDTEPFDWYYENGYVSNTKTRINRKISVIDSEGNEVFPYKSSPLNYSFSDGVFSLTGEYLTTGYFTCVPDYFGEKISGDYITNKGETSMIQPRFYNEAGRELFNTSNIERATPMKNGYAVVSYFDTPNDYSKFSNSCIIDKNGNTLFKGVLGRSGWSEAYSYGIYNSYRVASFLLGGLEFAPARISDDLVLFSSPMLFSDSVSEENIIDSTQNGSNSYGYYDIEGNIIIPQNNDYDIYGNFGNGLAWVGKYKNGTDNSEGVSVGFINKKGELVIPLKYDEAWQFGCYIDGYALVKSGDTYILIDTDGNEVSSFKLNDVKMYGTNGKVVSGEKDGKCGAVDINNNVILPFEYDDISGIQNDTCMAVKDGKVYSIRFKSNAAPFLGDFTGDNIIDGRDATEVLTLYAKNSVSGAAPTADELAKGDVIKDNILDGRDATAILTYYAKSSAGYTGTLQDFVNSQTE